MPTLQGRPEPVLSEDAIDHLCRAWNADSKKVAWARDRYPQLPAETALRAAAEAMWESAVPIITHYLARPRQMKRIRRRWIDTLSQQPFARWRDAAECHRAARPFMWETENDMAQRERRRTGEPFQTVSGSG